MANIFLQFQVKLLGEGADDAGGVFDDVITEMCRELVSTSSNLVREYNLGYFTNTPTYSYSY